MSSIYQCYCIAFALSVLTDYISLLASKTTPELNGDIYINSRDSADTIGNLFVTCIRGADS